MTSLAAILSAASCQTSPKPLGKRIDTQGVYREALRHSPEKREQRTVDDERNVSSRNQSIPSGASVQEQLGGGNLVGPNGNNGSGFAQFGAEKVSIAFDGAPIAEAANVIISQTLGADFVLDPNVKGTLSFRVTNIEKYKLPNAFDEALALSGYRLIQTSDRSFIVVPESAATKFSSAPSIGANGVNVSGIGQTIFPLRWVSAVNMQTAIRPFIPQGASVEIDEQRELLIFSGSPAQVKTLINTAEMFDVDWLSEMSFGVYETLNVPPDAMVEELQTVYGGENSPIGSQIEFVALPRLSSILVISKRPERLRQAESWIRRLDVNISGEGREFRFLSVQNADAEELANTLSEMFENDIVFRGGQNSGQGGNGFGGSYVGQDPDRVRIRADQASNSLIIYSSDAEFRQIRALMEKLDVLPDQVLIEVVIAEVSLTDDLRYGVQWFFDTRDDGSLTFSDAGSGAVSARFPGFAYAFNGNYVQAALSALSSVTDLEVVSSPQIVTQDNQSATLQVGDQVPVVTQSAVSVDNPNAPIVNSVQYRDTGILLTVTPRINDGNIVVLEVSQEVSSAIPTSSSGIDAPTIQQRQFTSVVNIEDGSTLALGGLIRSTRTKGRTGLPYVKDVPILGNLFSGQSDDRNRTELVIFLTPHIIRNSEDSEAATRHIKSKMPEVRARLISPDDRP